MWIENTNTATKKLKSPFMDSTVEFNDNGKAQVSREVGEQLAEKHESITVTSGSSGDGDDTDTEDTTETQESN